MAIDVETVVGSGPKDVAQDEETVGGINWSPASPYVKEMRKWEQVPTEWTVRSKPGNPYAYRPYPRMLYKAQQRPNGQWACYLPPPHPMAFDDPNRYEREMNAIDGFNRSCTRIVQNESEERQWKGTGWCDDPVKAMELCEQEQQAIGNAAAEAAFAVRRMSEKAQQEYADVEKTTHEHVTDVVGSSQKTRGRKPKAKPVSDHTIEDVNG